MAMLSNSADIPEQMTNDKILTSTIFIPGSPGLPGPPGKKSGLHPAMWSLKQSAVIS